MLRALLDHATSKGYRSGVLGVRARPDWTGPATFTHAATTARVVGCVSALAVREALLERDPAGWLVVLTDRDDLGDGVLSHLVWHRLRTPDPWDAVREQFAATSLDPALTTAPGSRELALGLLESRPTDGWPPAQGGVLTRDHAWTSVARAHLALTGPEVDATAVLTWTTGSTSVARIGDLRKQGGNALTDELLRWMAQRSHAIRTPLLALLRAGDLPDVVPLGLVVGVLVTARASPQPTTAQLARDGLLRLEPRLGGSVPDEGALLAWAGRSSEVLQTVPPAERERLLARADALLTEVQAGTLAGGSTLLPSGLAVRLEELATVLRASVPEHPPTPQPVLAAVPLAAVETAWARVAEHSSSAGDLRAQAFRAAVRLVRWLSLPVPAAPRTFAALVDRQGADDAWVDSAVNDAAAGVGSADLGRALELVLHAARARRAVHDRQFADALAAHTQDDPPLAGGVHRGVRHLEEVLATVVLPLARTTPTLFLLLDGMSTGVATEVVADVVARTRDGWVEALLPDATTRSTALAVLPTLTGVSRTSLFCGELRTGSQDTEQKGFAALTSAAGVSASPVFHKKPLESSRLGFGVADEVGAALDDTAGRSLVAAVLNTIDDALDRSDPAGIEWGSDAVKHLAPLLERARSAGRTVVLTADHGHVLERRHGHQVSAAATSSSRSRTVAAPATGEEVLVSGRRVLTDDHRAVLAVDESLRYGPLKAGYHGGASSAEAVVPLIVLVPGEAPAGSGLVYAPPQEPTWWAAPAVVAPPVPAAAAPTLFEIEQAPAPVTAPVHALAGSVLKSKPYAAQKKLAGRAAPSDDAMSALLSGLLAHPGQRLSPALAASALAVPVSRLRGAIPQAQRLLNVEGYAVLRLDADGQTLVLDEALLREQFGVL